MRTLYIGTDFTAEGKTGGTLVSRQNYLNLLDIYTDKQIDCFLIKRETNSLRRLGRLLRFRGFGLTNVEEKKILDLMHNHTYKRVFLDGSLHGQLARKIKKQFNDVKIITFFHNVDYEYVKEKMKIDGIRNIILLPSVYYNEKLSTSYSDEIIVLNNRDKENITKHYGRGKISIIPLALSDKYNEKETIKYLNNQTNTMTLLFVGSAFFANIQGIKWFINNVMPHIPGKLKVVGKGMECLIAEYSRDNVEIIGTVEDVNQYYYEADMVISPIFYGSGMKTKTTEALMFGKTIFGTSEAFEGFDLDYDRVGGICNSKDEFIHRIHSYINKKNQSTKFNLYSRNVYLEKYSSEAIRNKLLEVLGSEENE